MDNAPAPPRIWAYALVGHDDRLLLIPSAEPDAYVLPGGAVVSGEPAEHRLRRALREQLATTVSSVDFYAAIEHGTRDHAHHPQSEVALLFDVTLTDLDGLTGSGWPQHLWVDERALGTTTLRPKAVQERLLRASQSTGESWWAWTP